MTALNTALTTIRRSPYQALTSILMVAVTFFVAYSFSLFILGSHIVLKYFETQPQVLAFFELGTSSDKIQKISDEISSKSYVSSVKIITQEDALKLYQKGNSDDPLLLELVSADILPASIEVSGVDINSLATIKNDFEKFSEVEDIEFQEEVVSKLSKWISTIEIVGISSIVTLSTISFLFIMVIIAMKANSQKRKIEIMRMLGATKWYIKAPYMYEGMLYGLIGSIIGWITMFAVLLYVTPSLNQILEGLIVLPAPVEYYLIHLASGIVLGLFLGAFASIFAVQRFIKN